MASGQPSVASSKRASGRTPTQTLTPGTRVGRYQVGKVLRLGRAGITYRARDTVRGCDVALKEYLPVDIAARRSDLNVLPRLLQHVDDFVWGRDCFLAEARTLAALAAAAAPGIVGVDDSLEANGTAYMVTALPPRETLATWLTREGPLEPDRMTRLLMPLLDGLAQAHAAGMLHLDIKPANIALDDQGFARLCDFGGARAGLAARLPSSSAMPATGYTAIEQATFGETGPFTDIYALAATLYESISGIAPPPATKRPTERLAAVPRKAAKAHGPRLLSAIQAGLAVEPAERPASIAAWRSMLDEAIAAASTTAPTLKATAVAVSPPVPPSPSAASLDAALAMTFTVPTAAANTDGSVTSATAPPSHRAPGSTPPGPLDSLLASLAAPPTVLIFDNIALTPPLNKPLTPAPPSPSVSLSDGMPPEMAMPMFDSVPVAPPAAPPSAGPPALTITPTGGNLPMSPAASSVAGMSAETEAPVLDRVTVAPPSVTAASLRTDAPAPKTAPSSPATTDAAMAASLRAIADAVTAATVRPTPIAEVTAKTAPASPITAVHADPQARPRVIALSAKPGAPAPMAERSTGRPWERWKIALVATLAFATIPAGVAGYYVALPPSSAPPPAVVAPASDRLRGVSEAQAAAEANRRAETDARRAQEQADAEAKRSAAAQAEAAARQAAADAEATRQAEAAARQAAAEADAKRQADAAARHAAEAEAKRQAEAAAQQAAEAEATARRLHEEARAADESRRDTEARLAAAADARRRIEVDYAKATAEQAKAAAEARQEAAAAEAALKMSNRDKRRVQVALTSLGHDTFGADGSFGQRTRKMIAAWQKSRGEFESGYLTPPDLALLWVQAAPALARYERQMALEEQRRQEEEKRQATEAATQPSATVIEPPQVIEPPAPPLPQASQSLPPTPVAPARPLP